MKSGFTPREALKGVRDVVALQIRGLVLALGAARECGCDEVRAKARFVVEAGEEHLTFVDGEFVLHDWLGQERSFSRNG